MKTMKPKTINVQLKTPLDLYNLIESTSKAEGIKQRAVIERAVVEFIQAGCPSLLGRLARKYEAGDGPKQSVRERRIASAVRRALGEKRGTPRKHPLPSDEQAEVDRRVTEYYKANTLKPKPIYQTVTEAEDKDDIDALMKQF